MTQRNYTKSILLATIVLLSIGGWLLHFRIHSPENALHNYIPFISGILAAIVIPYLFCFKKTIHYAYVLNGFTVIIGTVVMAHYSLANLPDPVSIGDLIVKTTLGDIRLLWGKFFVGKALFDLEIFGYDKDKDRKGKWWRYPHMGWWWIHVVLVSAAYTAGAMLWK